MDNVIQASCNAIFALDKIYRTAGPSCTLLRRREDIFLVRTFQLVRPTLGANFAYRRPSSPNVAYYRPTPPNVS